MRAALCVCLLLAGPAPAAGFEAAIGGSVEGQVGNVPNQPGGSVDSAPSDVPDTVRTGVRLDLGARLGRFFVGPVGEVGLAPGCSLHSCYYYRVGLGTRFHFAPEAAQDPWVGVAATWELLGYKTGTNPGISETQHGPSGVLQIGVDFRWEGIRVAPVLGISAGAYHLAGRDTAHGGVALGLTFTL